jgi:signal transduction histidine kinase
VVAAPVAHRILRGFAVAGAIAFGAATIVVIRFTASWSTTYSGASSAAEAADLVAGLGLVAGGLLTRATGLPARTALPAGLAGIAWLAADWVGWQDGPPLARTVAMLSAPFLLPLLLDLVLTFPDGRFGSAAARRAATLAYGLVGVGTVAWILTYDPARDLDCWSNCTDNVFLVAARPSFAHALERGGLVLGLAAGLDVVAICGYRLATATPPARGNLRPVLLPGLVVGAAVAAHAVALLRRPLEGPEFAGRAALFQAEAWSVAVLGLGLVWSAVRARRIRSAIALLVSELATAPVPGSLAAALSAATNDPSLEVAYWLPGRDRFVDGRGNAVDIPESVAGRVVTPIVRNEQPVAVVVHDATAVSPAGLRNAIGAGARLAVDNERLRAELFAELDDLRASRARIVATGDAERQRLERNLHDGAQQRLLALSYDLRAVRSATDGDAELGRLADAAAGQIRETLAELRELAHGIYPAILTEGGLAPALSTLTDAARFPVQIDVVPEQRFSAAVERAAYLVVAGAVERAFVSGADHLRVRASADGDRLTVDVQGAPPGPYTYLGDRLGAIGGSLVVGPDLLRAEMPCV